MKQKIIKDLLDEVKGWEETSLLSIQSEKRLSLLFIFSDEKFAISNIKLAKYIQNKKKLSSNINYGLHPNLIQLPYEEGFVSIYTLSVGNWEKRRHLLNISENDIITILSSNNQGLQDISYNFPNKHKLFYLNQYRSFIHRVPFCFINDFENAVSNVLSYLANKELQPNIEEIIVEYKKVFDYIDQELYSFSNDNNKLDWI
nr:hypothetical protein [Terribacillus saccharophilus]